MVSDTSPFTALLTVGEADLLPQLFQEVIGLSGVVLLAKRKAIIPSARTLIERLDREAGMYLAEDVKEAALSSAGE
ncbi:MAG: DUF3368 domain-containing protein [Verrucomicrobia bacterium]|nr:DUF3368 domain-containing protein [Verrucomicrobiota bacterium]